MSAQHTLSTASEQAEKYGYPTWSIMSSTPCGTTGIGQFFYEFWQNAIPSDELFEVDTKTTKPDETNGNFIFERFREDADSILNNTPGTNKFVQIKFHWSEDPRKDDTWLVPSLNIRITHFLNF